MESLDFPFKSFWELPRSGSTGPGVRIICFLIKVFLGTATIWLWLARGPDSLLFLLKCYSNAIGFPHQYVTIPSTSPLWTIISTSQRYQDLDQVFPYVVSIIIDFFMVSICVPQRTIRLSLKRYPPALCATFYTTICRRTLICLLMLI